VNENITGNKVHTPAELAVLNDPLRNRGVAFTPADREALGLTGRLPSGVLTLEEQAELLPVVYDPTVGGRDREVLPRVPAPARSGSVVCPTD
jgi:hypothetical protein